MARIHPMPSADAAWFHMDRPTNHMVINAVLTFDDPLSLERLAGLVQERIVTPFPTFRRVVVERGPFGALHWEDAPHFDLGLHLHRLALPAPGDDAALQELVGDLMGAGLDRDKPLWDMYLVEGYGAGCALVVRMHHCIADGVALARVMLRMTDGAGDDAPAVRAPAPPVQRGRVSAVAGPLRSAASLARGAAAGLAHEGIHTLLHPEHVLELGRGAFDDAAALAALLTQPPEHPSLLKGEHGPAQRVGWTPPLPLAEVKETAHATATTVNDVLMAALSGALDRYLRERGEPVEELHVMVPFNVRPADEPLPAELGNKFGLINLALPLGAPSPEARLADVARRMADIKRSRQPAMSYALIAALGLAPVQLEDLAIDLFTGEATAVVTNVPGPREPVHLAGVPVRDVLVWAPCAGSIGMSVSIFSLCGAVTVGFMTHASLVPDPAVLAGHLTAELHALRAGAYASS